MNFTVFWRHLAQVQLATIWLRHVNREAVAEAADAVNRVLRESAHEQGESRDRPTRRIWFQRPLCVLFEIDAAASTVYVAGVKRVGT